MPKDAKILFYDLLKQEFAPRLREVGFKGSGIHFRRIRGEVINTINIQGNKYGGSSAVNLGLHLSFLPLAWNNELPDLAKIREVDCEFRNRLAPGRKADYWWKYSGLFVSPAKQVEHLVRTYFEVGEPVFARYDSTDAIADAISLDDVLSGSYIDVLGGVTNVRAALTMARIHEHLGDRDLAHAFAKAGLERVERATSLIPRFEEILERTKPE